MFRATRTVLDANAAIYAGVTLILEARTKFYAGIAMIEGIAPQQGITTTGYAALKVLKKRALAQAAATVAGPARGAIEAAERFELLPIFAFYPSDLEDARDSTCLARCRGIHTTATTEAAFFATAGLTAAHFAALATAIGEFDALVGRPKARRAETTTLTKLLAGHFKTTRAILKKQLDNGLELYRYSHPQFYSDYHNARRIDDLTGGSGGNGGAALGPVTGFSIAVDGTAATFTATLPSGTTGAKLAIDGNEPTPISTFPYTNNYDPGDHTATLTATNGTIDGPTSEPVPFIIT